MTHQEYIHNFLQKHGKKDWHVETSPMDEYGRYVKSYICEDGGLLTEVNGPKWVSTQVTVKGVTCRVDVKLMESECWNTDNAESVFFYEKW